MAQPMRDLTQVMQHDCLLAMECRACGHLGLADPGEVHAYCMERRWSPMLSDLEGKLRCSACAGRRIRVYPNGKRTGFVAKPFPPKISAPAGIDPQQWARADERQRRELLRQARG
jgi:hypothetical protein